MKLLSFHTICVACLCLLIVSCKKKDDDTNNTVNAIVFDCNNSTITTDVVWDNVTNTGVDYIVKCGITIGSGGSLTIKPGVKVQFEGGDAGIDVSEGSLNAVGTAASPIVLQGKSGIKGEWKGINIASNNAANVITYVTVRDAGSAGYSDEAAGLTLANNGGTARAIISNSIFRNNQGNGIWIRDADENLFAFANNTMDSNSTYPIQVYFDQLSKLDVASNYGGSSNGKSYIHISGDQSYEEDLNIINLSVPYYIDNYFNTIVLTRLVTIQTGVTLVFEADYKLYIEGTLVANGSASSPIIFRGLQLNAQGTWAGVLLRNNNSNVLNNCIFDGGGSSALDYAAKASLCIGENIGPDGKATLTDCTFKNSNGYGLGLKGAATVTQTGTVFTNNSLGDTTTY